MPDFGTVAANQMLVGASVLANDIDTGPSPLTAQLLTGALHGTVAVHSDGTYIYTPSWDFTGHDQFSYTATDGSASSSATVTITVTGNALTVSSFTASIPENALTTGINVLPYVSGSDGDPLTVDIVQGPLHGTASAYETGAISYMANSNFVGTDSLTFMVTEDGFVESNTATLTIDVTAAPTVTLANPGSQSNAVGDTVYLPLAATDSAGNAVTYSAQNLPPGLTLNSTTGIISGTVSSMATYGSPYAATVTATDSVNIGSSASQAFQWTVGTGTTTTVNLTNPGAQTDNDGATVSFGLTATDSAGNALTYGATNLPPGISIAPATGVISGTIASDADISSPYSVTVSATDDVNGSIGASQTFPWTVAYVPVLVDQNLSVLHDQPLTVDLSASVANPNPNAQQLQFTVLAEPAGTLTPTGDGHTYTFQPLAGWTGTDSFTIQASFGTLTSNIATVSISVTDTAPVAQPEQFTLQAGLTLSLNATNGLLHDAYDADGDQLTVQLVGPTTANGTLNLQPDGSLTYVANPGFIGDDSFSYRLFDGAEYSDTELVTIHVQYQAPIAAPGAFNVWASQGISASPADNVLANATDPENAPMTAVLFSGPQYAASFNLNADGTFTYVPIATPPPGFNGVDTFKIEANDGVMTSAPVTVTLNWNTLAVPQDGSYVLPASGQLTVSATTGVLANAFNPMNASLTAQLEQGIDPSIGTLNFNGDGSFAFTAGPAFTGEADFTYGAIQAGYGLIANQFPIVRIVASSVIGAFTGLLSVSFNGNATITDNSGNDLNPPQWVADQSAGDVMKPEVENPISFTRNTTISLTPIFNISPALASFLAVLGNNLLVHATSNMFNAAVQPLQLGFNQNIHLRVIGNELTTQGFVQMDSALPNATDYDSLNLTWQFSPDNGTTWITPTFLFPRSVQTAGNVSTDPIFVTLANPNGWNGAANAQKPTIPWTVFYVGTEGANANGLGATTNATLLTQIWAGFTTLNIRTYNGTPLQYWSGWNTQNLTTAQLIDTGNGQCYAWTALFQDVLNAWGDTDVITQKRIDTNPNNTVVGPTPVLAPQGNFYPTEFLVGSWNLGAAAPIPNIPRGSINAKQLLGGYTNYAVFPTGALPTNPVWIGLVGGQPGYLWTNGPLPPNVPTPAQNNVNPRADFENHAVVLINGVLYDPSYGVTYASLGAFAAGLGGFMAIIPFNNNMYNFNLNATAANNATSYWVALFKPITAAMLQLH